MPTNSSLDLQRFYPDELEIVSIEEDSDEIRLHMLSRLSIPGHFPSPVRR